MAKLGWGASVGLAVGAGAGLAAAQFGLGYGLDIISWSPAARGGTADEVWLASLAWTVFIATTSTAIGAIWADRRSAGEIGAPPRHVGSDGRVTSPGVVATAAWRTLLAFCAAGGALLSVALVLVQAKAAVRADTSSPELIAAGYAVVGVVIGILVTVCALTARAVTRNVLATALWLWVLAIAAAIDGLTADNGVHAAPLAAWPFGSSSHFRTSWSVTGTTLMFGAALVIGAGMAWVSARRGESGVSVAISGAVGPLVVAAVYLLTAPRLVGVRATAQVSAYLTAPYAVIAGLAGSVLVVVLFANRAARRTRRTRRSEEETAHAGWATALGGGPPGPRNPSDEPARASASERGADTVRLSAGKGTPGRLPTPPPSTALPGALAAAGSQKDDKTGTQTGPLRPSPRPRRRPGRR